MPGRYRLLIILFLIPFLGMPQGTGADGAITVSGTTYTNLSTTVASGAMQFYNASLGVTSISWDLVVK